MCEVIMDKVRVSKRGEKQEKTEKTTRERGV